MDISRSKTMQSSPTQEQAASSSSRNLTSPITKVWIVKEKSVVEESKIELLKKTPREFNPNTVSWWNNGEAVPFVFLCLAFDIISKNQGRTVKTEILSNALRTVMHTRPDHLLPTLYLCANRLSPAHEGLELGIGDDNIITALSQAFSWDKKKIEIEHKDKGDLGVVAISNRSSQSMICRPKPLTIIKVFNTFKIIAKKNLHIGSAEETLLAALGQAAVYTEKHSKPPSNIQSPLEEAVKIVKQVYSVLPVYDKIIPALLSNGIWNLAKMCSLTPGVPVEPMCANRTTSVSEIINKFQGMIYTCEYKYDGKRAQIHYMEDGTVEIYSRNAERNTTKFPDVVIAVSRVKKPSVRSFILDCGIVAYDHAKDKILPLQILSTRARKDVAVRDIKVEVCIFAFDILHVNDEPLIQEQLEFRRKRLYDSFSEEHGVFEFATAITITSNDVQKIQKFLVASVDSSCEGLMIKTLSKDATYEPSKRSNNWLKLKKDYMESIGDSLDLVPIAAYYGRGKRAGVYGSFLLACYNSNNLEYQSICKIGTGFSDSDLEERFTSLRKKLIPKPKPCYQYAADKLHPDVWFEPKEVWEVKASDLTISRIHRAAIGEVHPDKGISLRAPPLERVREDKNPEQATSTEQVAEMFIAQKHNHPDIQDEDEDEDSLE